MSIQCIDGHEFHERFNNITNTNIKQDFLSFTDETAKPRPDINIKVAAFITITKFNYTLFYSSDQSN